MNVPVIGQQFSIIGYMVLPVLHCNCEKGGTVALMVQLSPSSGFMRTADSCPACKRIYTVGGFTATADGQMQFTVEMSQPAPQLVAQ